MPEPMKTPRHPAEARAEFLENELRIATEALEASRRETSGWSSTMAPPCEPCPPPTSLRPNRPSDPSQEDRSHDGATRSDFAAAGGCGGRCPAGRMEGG